MWIVDILTCFEFLVVVLCLSCRCLIHIFWKFSFCLVNKCLISPLCFNVFWCFNIVLMTCVCPVDVLLMSCWCPFNVFLMSPLFFIFWCLVDIFSMSCWCLEFSFSLICFRWQSGSWHKGHSSKNKDLSLYKYKVLKL